MNCSEPNCTNPKLIGRSRCLEHYRASQRAYRRRRRQLSARLDFREMRHAIELCATAITFYRNGTGDRAIQLSQELRRDIRDQDRDVAWRVRTEDGLTVAGRR